MAVLPTLYLKGWKIRGKRLSLFIRKSNSLLRNTKHTPSFVSDCLDRLSKTVTWPFQRRLQSECLLFWYLEWWCYWWKWSSCSVVRKAISWDLHGRMGFHDKLYCWCKVKGVSLLTSQSPISIPLTIEKVRSCFQQDQSKSQCPKFLLYIKVQSSPTFN